MAEKLSIKELQARYNKDGVDSTNVVIDRPVEAAERDLQQDQIILSKKAATFSQAQLDQYAKAFEGFIQSCFDRRIQALSDPEVIEAETPLTKAMNNNIKLQVSLQLEEQLSARLAVETQKMLQEE